jgi:hypothetical protein
MGGQDWDDCGLREAQEKSSGEPHVNQKLGAVLQHLLCQAMQESEIRRIIVQGQLCQKQFLRLHLKGRKKTECGGGHVIPATRETKK